MYVTAEHLRDQVIRPTLEYMVAWSPASEAFLLNAAIKAPDLGLFAARNEGLGLFNITAAQHRDLWDRYLAFNPDMASRVRKYPPMMSSISSGFMVPLNTNRPKVGEIQ